LSVVGPGGNRQVWQSVLVEIPGHDSFGVQVHQLRTTVGRIDREAPLSLGGGCEVLQDGQPGHQAVRYDQVKVSVLVEVGGTDRVRVAIGGSERVFLGGRERSVTQIVENVYLSAPVVNNNHIGPRNRVQFCRQHIVWARSTWEVLPSFETNWLCSHGTWAKERNPNDKYPKQSSHLGFFLRMQ
jgi:hypothetical protein